MGMASNSNGATAMEILTEKQRAERDAIVAELAEKKEKINRVVKAINWAINQCNGDMSDAVVEYNAAVDRAEAFRSSIRKEAINRRSETTSIDDYKKADEIADKWSGKLMMIDQSDIEYITIEDDLDHADELEGMTDTI